MKNLFFFTFTILIVACGAPQQKKESPAMNIQTKNFDTIIDGKQIKLFILENENGIKVAITNYGACIVSVVTPDKEGKMADIALGYSSIEKYFDNAMYIGPVIGRFGNRIKDAKFTLDGKEYELFKNDGENTLHGGKEGFNHRVWEATQEGNSVKMTYLSPDGEEGYPGNLSISKTYSLNADNELKLEYKATTDAPTIINLTNHAYWNLKGEGDTTILDHYFMINADSYTPVDNEWIPTGEIASVEGTPFDFRQGKLIGEDINMDNEQLKNGLGYDHNWVLNQETEGELTLAGKLWENTSGRFIEFYTTEPGVQFYSGNFMDGTVKGKSGELYTYRSGLAIETQHFPDSPNQDNFPSTVLRPGENYHQITLLKFGTTTD